MSNVCEPTHINTDDEQQKETKAISIASVSSKAHLSEIIPGNLRQKSNPCVKFAQQMKLLGNWKKIAQEYAWMHEECAKHFLLLNYFMIVPIIFISTASGAVNLTGINSCRNSSINYVAITLGVVGLGTAGLSAIQNVLKYGERSISHKESAKSFEVLSRDISVEIILENTDSKTYANLAEFIKDCNEKFTLIMDRSNQIPAYIYKRLRERKENVNAIDDHIFVDIYSENPTSIYARLPPIVQCNNN